MRRRERSRRIIGIDPGSVFCGYGIIDCDRSGGYAYLLSGRIGLDRNEALHARLRELFTGLAGIIGEFHPHEAVVERIFYAKGVKAALNLGHARGIALLAASMERIPVFEYSALEVKKSVVGYGRADKEQVKHMVKRILNIRSPLSEDSADALALALCHAHAVQ